MKLTAIVVMFSLLPKAAAEDFRTGADGGRPFDSDLYSECPVTEEKAFLAFDADGGVGVFSPMPRALRTDCLLRTCDYFVKEVEKNPPSLGIGWWIAGFGLTLLGGILVGWGLGKLAPR